MSASTLDRQDAGFIVSEYTAAPVNAAGRGADRAKFFTALGELPDFAGLEVPFADPDKLVADIMALNQVNPAWNYVVTTVAHTMTALGVDQRYGIASTASQGRNAAVLSANEVHAAATQINDVLGRRAVTAVAFRSAPTASPVATGSVAALTCSLAELDRWEWGEITIVMEHCDARVPDHPAAKGFLTLDDGIDSITALAGPTTRLRLGVNWGRSVIETRTVGGPLAHISAARSTGLLDSVWFSRCSDRPSEFTVGWADAHLPFYHPAAPPTTSPSPASVSLLTIEHARSCIDAAGPGTVLGLTISCPPADAPLATRIATVIDGLQTMRTAASTTTEGTRR